MSADLTWLPAWSIRNLIADREVSPVEVVEHFLGRIEDNNKTLNAFQAIDEKRAREQATRAEEAVVDGRGLGPLHGVPISVKEYIPVEGLLHRDSNGVVTGPSMHDALSVERLRQAGAIVVGTNTAMGITEALLNPYNRELEARNPWDTGRVTGWSSSGGGAAAAAALVPIALGNDGGGSTRLPAAGCGVVGVHPTPGLVPEVNYAEPKLPALTTSSGPICRNVVDAAIALQAMAGPDGRDFAGTKTEPPNYLAHIHDGVEGFRFVWTDDFGFASMYAQENSAKIISAIREAAFGLGSLGASIEVAGTICDDFWDAYVTTNYLFQIAMDVPKPSLEDWERALDARQRTWTSFRHVLSGDRVLLCPTMQMVSPTIEDWEIAWLRDGDKYPHGTFVPSYTGYTHMFNWLAFPAISVPCGFVDGLPVGLQFVGLPGSEGRLLRAANAYQAAFPGSSGRPPVD
jgi:aspartyl-tRNA(Asn)/glutamyl-tRNA(Gln) amidotransferase subunit A